MKFFAISFWSKARNNKYCNKKININDNFPKYIIDNKEKFKDWIL